MKRSRSQSRLPTLRQSATGQAARDSARRSKSTDRHTAGPLRSSTTPLPNRLKPALPRQVTSTLQGSFSKSPHRITTAQLGDKRWVADQFAKVLAHLQATDLDPQTYANLRQPTLKAFVAVMQTLLQPLDPQLQLNTQNYKELVLDRLRLLRYPGAVSISLLKTANTPHSWPQVVAVWAWLVEVLGYLYARPERRRAATLASDYLFARYQNFNMAGGRSDAQAAEDFEGELHRLHGFSEEAYRRLEGEIAGLVERKNRLEAEGERGRARVAALRPRQAALAAELADYYAADDSALLARRDALQRELDERGREAARLEAGVAALERTVRAQRYGQEDLKALQERVRFKQRMVELKQVEYDSKLRIRDELDLRLTSLLAGLQDRVAEINAKLVPLALSDERWLELKLPESGYSDDLFTKILDDFFARKSKVEEVMQDDLQEAKQTAGELNGVVEELSKENEEIDGVLARLEVEKEKKVEVLAKLKLELMTLKAEEKVALSEKQAKLEEIKAKTPDCTEKRKEFDFVKDRYIKEKIEWEEYKLQVYEIYKKRYIKKAKILKMAKEVYELKVARLNNQWSNQLDAVDLLISELKDMEKDES